MASHMMGPLLRASFQLDLAGTGSRISQIGNATIDRIRHLLCHYQIHFLKFFNVVYLFTSHWRFLKITWAGMWFTLFKVLIFLGEEWIFHVFSDFLRSNWPTETAPCFWSLWHLVLLVSMSLSSLCWCLLLALLMPASIHLECCAYSSKKDRKTAFFWLWKGFPGQRTTYRLCDHHIYWYIMSLKMCSVSLKIDVGILSGSTSEHLPVCAVKTVL